MCRYMKLLVFVVILFCGFFNIFHTAPAQAGEWSKTENSLGGKGGASTVGISDGRVISFGGQFSGLEVFDPATGTWALLPNPGIGVIHHLMGMFLQNGKALVIGSSFGKIWLYDPRSDSWSEPASFGDWEIRYMATLLKNGDFLGIDHRGFNTICEIYDYRNESVHRVGNTAASHWGGCEVLLPDGRVFLVGGFQSPSICEIYDPNSESWTRVANTLVLRGDHLAVLLPPPWNKVLAVGGADAGNQCELYDPLSDSWELTDSLQYILGGTRALALLPSGKVLTAGAGSLCELYDPEAGTWSITDSMEMGRGHHSVALLQTGKVIAIGSFGQKECEIYDPSDGKGNWATKSYTLNTGRAAHTVTPLPIIHIPGVCSTNILISGGENSLGALASCEVYNYNLDQGALTDNLNEARSHHTAVLLSDGKVLVAGGKDGATTRSSSELYDVSTQLWTTTTGAMTDARFDHSATLLKNGDVFVTGGENGTYLSSCEIYSGGNWTPTANVMATPRARHTAVIILLNGDILVIGGQTTGGTATATCELWNGTSWTGKASMSTARYWHTATLLQSGKVLVAGGTADGSNGLTSCEIFDPDSNKWFPEGNLNTARYLHNTTILYSGLVMISGGNSGITSCEIWDPAAGLDETTNTHEWKDIGGTLAAGRAYHSSVLLPIDKPYILTIGGKSGSSYLNSIERYDVGLEYRSIWQSTITNHSAVTLISPSMDINGTLFRGVSEADGGNHCHISSNDHPIISLVRIGGGNWQGNGGGEILHMPLSSDWDTAHTIVHPEITDFQGYYRLWSIVNGIPCNWYNECLEIEEKTGIRHKATGISVSVYPNPATTKASIKFRVQSSELENSRLATHNSQLTIYDLSGRLVRSLPITDSRLTTHEVTWDGQDSKGKKVNSGIYFYSIKHKNSENRGKFVILK